MVYSGAVEAGNKLIANLGRVNMYGQPRSAKMSRLRSEALKDSNGFYVEAGLDWVAGDRLGLLATSFESGANDDVTISSYNATDGYVTTNEQLSFYHFGRSESTAALYNGVDIRGEVILLSRNVKIAGDNIESWGGQIITGFTIDNDGTLRYG